MKTRIFWLACALVAFAILVPISISFNEDWQVYSKGSIVEAEITHLPGALGFLKFRIGGHDYDLKLSQNAGRSFHIGQIIQLRFKAGYEGHILFPNENPLPGGIAAMAMFLLSGIAFIYYGCKKNPPSLTE